MSSLAPFAVALAMLAVLSLSARPRQPPIRDTRLFRSGIELTSITAVTDRDGHLITGLPREAFDIYRVRSRNGHVANRPS